METMEKPLRVKKPGLLASISGVVRVHNSSRASASASVILAIIFPLTFVLTRTKNQGKVYRLGKDLIF
jgi:hypothetical protein